MRRPQQRTSSRTSGRSGAGAGGSLPAGRPPSHLRSITGGAAFGPTGAAAATAAQFSGAAAGPAAFSAGPSAAHLQAAWPEPAAERPSLIETGAAASLSLERRDQLCSIIGLTVKVGLVLVAGVSLVRLAGAYRERMDRQGELSAVLQLEQAKLAKARDRFDQLFQLEGEQQLIREQNQWIAPNRLRVVFKPAAGQP